MLPEEQASRTPLADDSEMPYKVGPFTRTTTPDIATKLQSFLAGARLDFESGSPAGVPVEDATDDRGYIFQRYLDYIEALQRSHRRLMENAKSAYVIGAQPQVRGRLLGAVTEAELLESKWAKEAGE